MMAVSSTWVPHFSNVYVLTPVGSGLSGVATCVQVWKTGGLGDGHTENERESVDEKNRATPDKAGL